MGMVAAPLVIGEVIVDTEKKWRAMRLVPVLGALASEALWTMKIAHDRKREEEAHAALEDCRTAVPITTLPPTPCFAGFFLSALDRLLSSAACNHMVTRRSNYQLISHTSD
jgi:hypothetical protein